MTPTDCVIVCSWAEHAAQPAAHQPDRETPNSMTGGAVAHSNKQWVALHAVARLNVHTCTHAPTHAHTQTHTIIRSSFHPNAQLCLRNFGFNVSTHTFHSIKHTNAAKFTICLWLAVPRTQSHRSYAGWQCVEPSTHQASHTLSMTRLRYTLVVTVVSSSESASSALTLAWQKQPSDISDGRVCKCVHVSSFYY